MTRSNAQMQLRRNNKSRNAEREREREKAKKTRCGSKDGANVNNSTTSTENTETYRMPHGSYKMNARSVERSNNLNATWVILPTEGLTPECQLRREV